MTGVSQVRLAPVTFIRQTNKNELIFISWFVRHYPFDSSETVTKITFIKEEDIIYYTSASLSDRHDWLDSSKTKTNHVHLTNQQKQINNYAFGVLSGERDWFNSSKIRTNLVHRRNQQKPILYIC